AAVEQGCVAAGCTDVEVDLAMIFDITVDSVAIPEGVVPAEEVTPTPAAPSEARTIEGRTPERAPGAEAAGWILDIARLAMVDAVAELDDHVRTLGVVRRPVPARFQLLRNNPGVTLKLETAVPRHASVGHDIEGLALRRGHRLVTRHGRGDGFGAGGKRDGGGAERDRGCNLADTHGYSPPSGYEKRQ